MKTTSDKIFGIRSESDFRAVALEIFHFQAEHNPVYREYIQGLRIDPEEIREVDHIPFLPIEFFKTRQVISCHHQPELVFTSSGTTGTSTSRHFVKDPETYSRSFLSAFRLFYGEPSEYCILALLPSYLEREGSSLVYMAEELIHQSQHPLSGFFLHEIDQLNERLNQLESKQQKTLLLGVTYALLDLADKRKPTDLALRQTTVMETGGMKGKRKEMVREELHNELCRAFHTKNIHSEYGMTELLSQAYSKGDGLFRCPLWMKVLIRDANDPFHVLPEGRSGGINVIDLANVNSCSFIATQDLGKKHPNDLFEVLGRFDNSDLRGCNLLVG